MAEFQTPTRIKPGNNKPVLIPPSPFLKKLGYGTGVMVYKFERSPLANNVRSPWAIKKIANVKCVSSEFGKRLKEEANILQKLNHPNIVGFRAFAKTTKGEDCLAMEECNISLGDLISEKYEEGLLTPYPANKIMKVALDTSKALNYLHNTALLLHCDVKSFNILVKGDFAICKLCDFGVCLPVLRNGTVDLDKAGEEVEYVGTPVWSAPEILKFPQVITTKADIFSFGLVLWEMLALTPPFSNISDDSVYSSDSSLVDSEDGLQNMENLYGTRPDLPQQEFNESYNYVLELFHCCTEKDPKDRPSAHDLERIITDMTK